MKIHALIFLLFLPVFLASQEITLTQVEPPFWWTGFQNTKVQLLVHGKNISSTRCKINKLGIRILRQDTVTNPNYLFVTLELSKARPGRFDLLFNSNGKTMASYSYELKKRNPGSAQRESFTSADVIYLLMPDRFSNGDTTNDNISGMKDPVNRSNPDGRHGGDIKGIADHLGYFNELGVTAVWINPLLENNQPKYSYHGYSTTDYYKVDPRFGTNEDYLRLSDSLHKHGLKLIMDMIMNHCGSEHWWMKDLPSPDWINQWPEFTRSTYRAGSVTDPYVSQHDSNLFVRGWFDQTMPDMNQRNRFLKTYLIQNSIWWIENAGLDGIRQDTHPYPFKDMMSEWGKAIHDEYPGFNIVGECWVNYPASVAYWQDGAKNKDGYNSNLPSVFDFPLYDALNKAFNEPEGWNTGILRLYEILSQDFSYPDPFNLVTFADNHDVNRYLDTQNDDIRKLKMALAFILTTRGIPQIYYGSEILMTTGQDKGHGSIRKDFPGGWPDDKRTAFIAQGRTVAENDMFNFLKTILNWRKGKMVIQTGKLCQFIPQDGIYVYFRYDANETVMMLFNNNDLSRTIETSKYKEFLGSYKSGREIIANQPIDNLVKLTIPAKSAMIIELKK